MRIQKYGQHRWVVAINWIIWSIIKETRINFVEIFEETKTTYLNDTKHDMCSSIIEETDNRRSNFARKPVFLVLLQYWYRSLCASVQYDRSHLLMIFHVKRILYRNLNRTVRSLIRQRWCTGLSEQSQIRIFFLRCSYRLRIRIYFIRKLQNNFKQ